MIKPFALGIAVCMTLACAAAGRLAPLCEPEEVVVIDFTPVRCEETAAGSVCELEASEERVSFDAAACELIALAPDAPAEHEGSVFEALR